MLAKSGCLADRLLDRQRPFAHHIVFDQFGVGPSGSGMVYAWATVARDRHEGIQEQRVLKRLVHREVRPTATLRADLDEKVGEVKSRLLRRLGEGLARIGRCSEEQGFRTAAADHALFQILAQFLSALRHDSGIVTPWWQLEHDGVELNQKGIPKAWEF